MNRAPARFATLNGLPTGTTSSKSDASVFGKWQELDAMPAQAMDAEAQFRQVQGQSGIKRSRQPFSGSLPFATTPKTRDSPSFRLVPVSTRSPNVRTEFEHDTQARGPWYMQQWPIWDNLQFLPSRGDVALDPRYGTQTKGAACNYVVLN